MPKLKSTWKATRSIWAVKNDVGLWVRDRYGDMPWQENLRLCNAVLQQDDASYEICRDLMTRKSLYSFLDLLDRLRKAN